MAGTRLCLAVVLLLSMTVVTLWAVLVGLCSNPHDLLCYPVMRQFHSMLFSTNSANVVARIHQQQQQIERILAEWEQVLQEGEGSGIPPTQLHVPLTLLFHNNDDGNSSNSDHVKTLEQKWKQVIEHWNQQNNPSLLHNNTSNHVKVHFEGPWVPPTDAVQRDDLWSKLCLLAPSQAGAMDPISVPTTTANQDASPLTFPMFICHHHHHQHVDDDSHGKEQHNHNQQRATLRQRASHQLVLNVNDRLWDHDTTLSLVVDASSATMPSENNPAAVLLQELQTWIIGQFTTLLPLFQANPWIHPAGCHLTTSDDRAIPLHLSVVIEQANQAESIHEEGYAKTSTNTNDDSVEHVRLLLDPIHDWQKAMQTWLFRQAQQQQQHQEMDTSYFNDVNRPELAIVSVDWHIVDAWDLPLSKSRQDSVAEAAWWSNSDPIATSNTNNSSNGPPVAYLPHITQIIHWVRQQQQQQQNQAAKKDTRYRQRSSLGWRSVTIASLLAQLYQQPASTDPVSVVLHLAAVEQQQTLSLLPFCSSHNQSEANTDSIVDNIDRSIKDETHLDESPLEQDQSYDDHNDDSQTDDARVESRERRIRTTKLADLKASVRIWVSVEQNNEPRRGARSTRTHSPSSSNIPIDTGAVAVTVLLEFEVDGALSSGEEHKPSHARVEQRGRGGVINSKGMDAIRVTGDWLKDEELMSAFQEAVSQAMDQIVPHVAQQRQQHRCRSQLAPFWKAAAAVEVATQDQRLNIGASVYTSQEHLEIPVPDWFIRLCLASWQSQVAWHTWQRVAETATTTSDWILSIRACSSWWLSIPPDAATIKQLSMALNHLQQGHDHLVYQVSETPSASSSSVLANTSQSLVAWQSMIDHLNKAHAILSMLRRDPSLLEPLDFPLDQYAAMLAPLLLPLWIPLLVSMIQEYRRYRKKKENVQKTKQDSREPVATSDDAPIPSQSEVTVMDSVSDRLH